MPEAAQAAAPRRISLIVFGDPAAQGSKRHVGGGRMIEQSKKVGPFREAVKYAARLEIDARPGWLPLGGDQPVVARMVFTFTRPRSHYRTGRNAHLLRDAAPSAPLSPPDLDKLARACCDAIQQAGIVVDDARIVEFLRLAKVYAGEDVDALDVPGVRIEVREAIR